MNAFGKASFLMLVAVSCHVYAQRVPTSTPCSLSFYRYLYNLPGEQIRPNVPEGTYVFGKRVGPPSPEGQASNAIPAVLKPAPSYEAPLYLPPPKPTTTSTTTTTTTTTTTPRPTTSAPLYIPPSPYYPAEASNTVSVVQPVKPNCEKPGHVHQIDAGLLPPYRVEITKFQQPQPTFLVPQFVPLPSQPRSSENEIVAASPRKPAFPAFPPAPRFPSYNEPAPATENCDKHRPRPVITTTSTTPEPTTTPEPVVETRQNEIVVLPEPHAKAATADCGHKQHNVVVESLGVPSTDYGVVSAPAAPAPSAGYSYDRPSEPLAYPTAAAGYTYPKASPSFEYPGAFASQAQSLFESESPKSSVGNTDDGDLVILKV